MTAAQIAERLAGRAADVCAHLFPAGRRNGDEYEVGDIHGAPGKSLRINLNGKAGVWADFATGDKGDLLDAWRLARGLETAVAMREAAEWLGCPPRGAKAAESASFADAPAGHPNWKGTPTGRWCYPTADGTPHIVVYRYDKPDGSKVFFQYDCIAQKWCSKRDKHALPARRPLYRLDAFVRRPAGEIVLVEGEKCADALNHIGVLATSTLGGSGQVAHADFRPLAGWTVTIWPDADEAGRKYATTAAAMLREVGAEPQLVPVPDGVPESWDAADAIRDGWTLEEVRGQLGMAEPVVKGDADADLAPEWSERLDRALRTLDTVQVVPASFLWKPYLPLGNITLLGGDYAVGTTWVMLAIVAAGSRGYTLPDGRTGTIVGGGETWPSLYLSVENDPETVRFRIDQLGGDPSKVTIWDTRLEPLPSLEDLSLLDAAIARTKARFVGIDPIQSALGHKVDINRANEVRALLDRLAALARKHQCALLCRIHLNKAATLAVKHRLMGSIDFAAAARSILIAAPLPDSSTRRALVHLKCSIAREGVPLSFALEGDDSTVSFTWGNGPLDVDLDEIMQPPKREATNDTRVGGAMIWLRDFLRGGAKTYDAVVTEGAAAGFAESTIKRAGKSLKVMRSSWGFPKRSTWEMPGGIV